MADPTALNAEQRRTKVLLRYPSLREMSRRLKVSINVVSRGLESGRTSCPVFHKHMQDIGIPLRLVRLGDGWRTAPAPRKGVGRG